MPRFLVQEQASDSKQLVIATNSAHDVTQLGGRGVDYGRGWWAQDGSPKQMTLSAKHIYLTRSRHRRRHRYNECRWLRAQTLRPKHWRAGDYCRRLQAVICFRFAFRSHQWRSPRHVMLSSFCFGVLPFMQRSLTWKMSLGWCVSSKISRDKRFIEICNKLRGGFGGWKYVLVHWKEVCTNGDLYIVCFITFLSSFVPYFDTTWITREGFKLSFLYQRAPIS